MKGTLFIVVAGAAAALLAAPLSAQDASPEGSYDDERPMRVLAGPRSVAPRETAPPARAGMDPAAVKKLDDILQGVKDLKDEVKKLKDEIGIIKIRVTQSQ